MVSSKDMRRPDLSMLPLPYAARLNPASETANGHSRWAGANEQSVANVANSAIVVPYQEPAASSDKADFSSTISSTLPMAAMFTRNRYIGWAAVVFTIQNWLGESEETTKNSSTPGVFSVLMSVMALGVTYMPLFLPPSRNAAGGSNTEAPAPIPAS
ncbi:hypothetical protein E5D57_001967 [Metarhizium anisopliae]|nr:hypothetical protein E5D57_001967 [Metarhizium anisopliae]